MTCSYYIYYRVNREKAQACEPRIRELFAAVQKATGISGRLLRKRGEPLLSLTGELLQLHELLLDVVEVGGEGAPDLGDRASRGG